jgi:hypothetical protein
MPEHWQQGAIKPKSLLAYVTVPVKQTGST